MLKTETRRDAGKGCAVDKTGDHVGYVAAAVEKKPKGEIHRIFLRPSVHNRPEGGRIKHLRC
jgi:hypothetical protein